MEQSRWFLAQANPDSVEVAQRNLQVKNFKTFLPLEEVPRQCFGAVSLKSAGATLSSTRPIFPDHLFVALDMSQDFWSQIHSTFGLARIVKIGKSPAVVPTLLVTELMQRCDRKGLLRPIIPQAHVDHVTSKRMPFANFLAEVESTARARRVCLLKNRLTVKPPILVPGDRLQLV